MDNEEFKRIFSGDIQKRTAGLFGADHDSLEYITVSENMVFSYASSGKKRILRVTQREGRSTGQIEAELDWMAFLADRGASVPHPVHSLSGKLVETVEAEGETFRATSLTWLPGRALSDNDIDDTVIREWGRTIGQLHRLTKDYTPAPDRPVRFSWEDDDDLCFGKHIPNNQPRVIEAFRKVISQLHELPVCRNCFGLVHSDPHYHNFFWDRGRIRLFDFDDCSYNWFLIDIATVWYWALHLPQGEGNRTGYMRRFQETFMDGYETENILDRSWMDRIPLFLQYLEMLLYVYFYRITDTRDMSYDDEALIARYRERIENGVLWFGKMEG